MQDVVIVVLVSLALVGLVAYSCIAADPGPASEQDGPAEVNAPLSADRGGQADAAPAEDGPAQTEPGPDAEAPPAEDGPAFDASQFQIIKSIEFEGNRKFKDHVLRERLGFELGDRLDPFLAEGGRLTIAEVYRKIGYPSVEVSLDRERLEEGHLLYAIEEGPSVQIGDIDFVGNDRFRNGTLKQVIKTTERKWLLWPFYYTEEAIDEDLHRLRDFYYDKGYLDHEITAETELSPSGEKVYVTFAIEEGPLYHVAEIAFVGNTQFTDEQLRALIELEVGDVYMQQEATRDARELANLYREHGYVDAVVRQSPKFTPEAEENLVIVEFDVREGRQFRIGRIDVTGNEVTKDKVVRRVLDEYGFTPGELYDAKLAPKGGGGILEKYVQRAATAQTAMIRPIPPASEDPNVRDVRVDMEEGMTGLIRPGVGFSSDHGIMGQLIYQQNNFDITDWPESLAEFFMPWKAFRGAGQRLSLRLEPGTRYSQYSINFVDRYWRDEPITLDVLGRSWERWRESHDEERLKAAVGLEQRLEDRWRRSIGLRVENVGVKDLDFDAPREIRDVEGNNELYGLRLGLGLTELDDRYDPTEGQSISVSYEQVIGDHTFGLLEGTYVHYWTLYEDVLGRRTVLAAKVLAGTTVDDTPPFEKFYAGGTGHYGLRGFEYRGVSTRGLQTNVDTPERKDPIGSDWIFLTGAEITVPLVGENFGLLFFTDSGTVDTGSYRLSIGTGIEVKVPQFFGNIPMRFEVATPLLKDEEDERQVFSFSGGGLF